jgi:CheY-like chemotaxis protein/ribonuclease BN (tRNA processing enzyme)
MALKVLVVDDDDIAGGLSRELLAEAGFEADLQTNSLKAIDQIRSVRYPLVVLDILMPGLDGLTLCHKIKSDPELKDTKVVMVSGKSFDADKQRARQYGAALFIEKPYNVEMFATQIRDLLGASQAPVLAPDAKAVDIVSIPGAAVEVAVYGSRSLGQGPAASRFGLKTSCMTVDLGDNLLIFDAGGGLETLGPKLVAEGKRKDLWLFLTHFHKDHTQGLGTFACAQDASYTLHIAGAREPDKPLDQLVQEAFAGSMKPDSNIAANIDLYEMLEDTYEVIPGVNLTSFYANHPGTTLGYVLSAKGKKIVYCPDSELYGDVATAMQDYDERLGRICAGVDLLIHDARYTPEDYRTLKNNGHSSYASTVDFAGRHGLKKLLLTHQDAQYPDEALDRMEKDVARIINEKKYDLQCSLAKEGLKLGL